MREAWEYHELDTLHKLGQLGPLACTQLCSENGLARANSRGPRTRGAQIQILADFRRCL